MSEDKTQVQSLISISPSLYRRITKTLAEDHHIHSYDIQLFGMKKADGIQIIINYGERFERKSEQFFFFDELENGSDELKKFIESTGESCKKGLIDDYFKRMAP